MTTSFSLSNLQRQIIHTTPDIGRRKVDSAAEQIHALNPMSGLRRMRPARCGQCDGVDRRYDLCWTDPN